MNGRVEEYESEWQASYSEPSNDQSNFCARREKSLAEVILFPFFSLQASYQIFYSPVTHKHYHLLAEIFIIPYSF